MQKDNFLDHSLGSVISIILVEPQESLNVGAVARAMLNLGFEDLRLVNPKYTEDKAWVTARAADSILKNSKEFSDLKDALKDFNIVFGLSARDSLNRFARMTLIECAENINGDSNKKIAILFGPEATGLRKEHLDLCTHLVKIPTSAKLESLNLAQAATLVMYEITRSLSKQSYKDIVELANINEIGQLEKLVDSSAELSGFYGKGTPSHIPSVVHNLLKRIKPTKKEIAVMLGLFSKIKKALSGEIPISKVD